MKPGLLSVQGLKVSYGQIEAVRGIDFAVEPGRIGVLLGPNGAGKSSTLWALTGLVPATGAVRFARKDILGLPTEEIIPLGMALVPEGRRIFPSLSVGENLMIGAATQIDRATRRRRRDEQLARFPILAEKLNQPAGLLSGGQQQMLAIGRALMSAPELLILDEPSLGLAPQIVDEIFDLLLALRAGGTTLLVIEQNAAQALSIADCGWVLQGGRIVLEGSAAELLDSDLVRQAYLAL